MLNVNLAECYVEQPLCKSRSKHKILKGEHKGKDVFVCLEGCSKENRDCPFDIGNLLRNCC